ncbi:MAG: hypothetical protein ACE5HS_06635 [bacterium]
MSKIDTDHLTLFTDFIRSKNDVYPAAATKIYHHIARLEFREASGITTTP